MYCGTIFGFIQTAWDNVTTGMLNLKFAEMTIIIEKEVDL
jgi:hypothetical protein